MRIVHYLHAVKLERGGVARALLDMCIALAQAGHDVTLLCCEGPNPAPDWGAADLPHLRIITPPGPTMGLLPGSMFRRNVEEVLRGADVLHVHGMWGLSGYAAAAVARESGVPYIISPHGMLDDWPMSLSPRRKRLALALLGRRLLRNARYVHCAAAGELAESSKWFPEWLGRVAPLPFDLSDYDSLPGDGPARERFSALQAPGPKVLFLSRLVENKGAHFLLDAMPALLIAAPDAQLIVAGSGETSCEAALRAQARCLGIERSTHFLGHIGGIEKVSLLQACDVFVLPTIHENFGFAILESLAAGTPVVTTKGAMLWRELAEGGAVITDRAAAAIVNAVAPLLADRDAARKDGERGRAWVFEFLAAERILQSYEEMYAPTRTQQPGGPMKEHAHGF